MFYLLFILWNEFGQIIQRSSKLPDIPRGGGTINMLNILINISLLNKLRIGNNSKVWSKKLNIHSST